MKESPAGAEHLLIKHNGSFQSYERERRTTELIYWYKMPTSVYQLFSIYSSFFIMSTYSWSETQQKVGFTITVHNRHGDK